MSKRILTAESVISSHPNKLAVIITDSAFYACLGQEKATKDGEIEIGYWIGVPFWGNGYIPEAVKALQKHAFEDLGCTAMWCGYYDGNEKSKRCQEKCGFVYHHTEENKLCALMGDVRTEHYTYLTKKDWNNGVK